MTPEWRRTLVVLLVLLVAMPLSGSAREERLEDPELRERFQNLAEELRCPKCQNESIAESGAPISSDMRERVRSMLREGYSDQEIREQMVARFGDFVSYRPEFSPRTWILWPGPFAAIAVGIAFVVLLALRARRKDAVQTRALTEEERRRAEQWLRDDSN